MERILVIEDDFAIRNSVEFALRREGYEVKSLDSGDGAVRAVRSFDPDLVLLDIMLPGKNGLEICEGLRQSDQRVAIIIVSALGEEHDRVTGLRLGADDYVSKPFSLDELLARVRANLRRSAVRERSGVTHDGRRLVFGEDHAEEDGGVRPASLSIDPLKREVVVGGVTLALRAKEFTLLYALASRADEVLTREILAEEVWGQHHLDSSRTIDVHIRRLRLLLEEQGAAGYLRTVHGVGYRFVADGGLGDGREVL